MTVFPEPAIVDHPACTSCCYPAGMQALFSPSVKMSIPSGEAHYILNVSASFLCTQTHTHLCTSALSSHPYANFGHQFKELTGDLRKQSGWLCGNEKIGYKSRSFSTVVYSFLRPLPTLGPVNYPPIPLVRHGNGGNYEQHYNPRQHKQIQD